MDTVKWALELQDKVSPAGKKILASFNKFGDSAKKLATKGLTGASKGFSKLSEKIAEATPKLAKWAAIGLAAGATGLAYAGARLLADAAGFRDATMVATKALLKSGDAASTAYARMLDFAKVFGEDPKEALGKFNAALAAGFSPRDAEKLLQAFGDLRLVTPNINADSLIGAFGTIRSKARVELGDFQAAVTAGGLNVQLAYEALGKRLGVSAKEAERMLGAGRVDASTGLVGLIDAINKRTNSSKVGEKLTEYANTASGLVERLKNLPQQYMLRLSADDSPIKGTLTKLLAQLDPDSPNGKKIIGALDAALTSIGTLLSTWATPEGIEKLTKMITKVITAAPKVISAIDKVAGAINTISDAFDSFGDNCNFLWAEFKRGDAIVTAMALVLALPLAPAILLHKALRNVGDFFTTDLPKAWDSLKDFAKKAADWGGNVVDGFWTGIKEKWAGLLSKMKGLLNLLPDAAKKALGIASPAKSFMPIGRFSAEGVGVGFDRAMPQLHDTIGDGLAGTVATGIGAATSVSSSVSSTSIDSSRRGSPVVVHVGDVSFDGVRDGRGAAQSFVRELRRELEFADLGGV